MSQRCILIVDDDSNFRSAQKRVIRGLRSSNDSPYEVREAANGEDALTALQDQDIDCVLIDYQMPGGTGLEWLSRMLSARPELAVIMITGRGSEQLAVDAMKNGAMDYLVKGSITPEELERAIINAIDKCEMKRTIKNQREKLLDAERHRVMIESLATACHHLGQPATVISTYLEIMKQLETDDKMKDMLDQCTEAANGMADVLKQLREVNEYRTEPYLSDSGKPVADSGTLIEL
ncbi:hypothetical protein BVX97_03170 [bacterium E08(2017)]|nr:hypothetical protein BVX97_03170 [bacterium E08(2017)]